jgi:AraC-like DNA-binding protein
MDIQFFYGLLLATSLSMLIAQLTVREKRAVHITFAIFCGSIAMVATQQLTPDNLGIYKYLIGFGTCATCNAFWLVSRALFREKSAISLRHILVAVVIAGLIMINQGIEIANAMSTAAEPKLQAFANSIGEVTNLLSSCILMLTLWEAIRGYNSVQGAQRWQRLVFVACAGTGIFACSVVATALYEGPQLTQALPWFVVFSALQILIVTQGVLLSQHYHNKQAKVASKAEQPKNTSMSSEDDDTLITGIKDILYKEQIFLQPNLKMVDLAHRLDVPEYRVSRALRFYFNGRNFNQFINSLRIEYARKLLEEPSNQHWTILVVALESGFASIGPFNRAFRAEYRCTPYEYRQRHNINKEGCSQIAENPADIHNFPCIRS